MCLNIIHVNDYISHFSKGSTVPHFHLNLRPYNTTQIMNMTKLGDEIQKKTEQLEKIKIDGQRLTPAYIKQNTFREISSGK